MKKFTRLCAILAAFIPMSAMANSDSHLFSSFFVFGDSLSDIGNGSSISTGQSAPLTTPGGQLFPSHLANDLGLSLSASSKGGTDYAEAGAETGPLNFTNSYPQITTILAQTQNYLQSVHGHADPHALYSVWGGANDINDGLVYAATQDFTPAQTTAFGSALIQASVGNIAATVNALHAAGANYIIVPNLPDLSATPAASEHNFIYASFYGIVYTQLYNFAISLGNTPEEATIFATTLAPSVTETEVSTNGAALTSGAAALSNAFDTQLLSSLNATGYSIIQIDVKGLLQAIQSNYALFGFSAPNSSYISYQIVNGVPVPVYDSNPNRDVFYDGFHPSSMTDKIGADYVLSVLQGPLYAGALAEAPFAVFNNQNTSIQSELVSLQNGFTPLSPCRYRVFASGIQNPGSVDGNKASLVQPGYDWDNTAFTVGADYAFTPDAIGGIAVGRSMGDVNYDHHAGGFDIDENMVTAFGGYQWKNFFVDGELNYGNIDYSHVNRHFMLGTLPETVTGETTGDHYGAATTFGYNFSLDNDAVKTGPIGTLEYQKVVVNPYAEVSSHFQGNNGAFDALQYAKQSNDELTGGLGWQASVKTTLNTVQIQPYLQATYNHQFLTDTRMVKAGVVTLPGSQFELPFIRPGDDFGLVNAGIQGIFSHGIALTVGYNGVVGKRDVRSNSFSLSASVPL